MKKIEPRQLEETKTYKHLQAQQAIATWFVPIIFGIGVIWYFTPDSVKLKLRTAIVPAVSGGSGFVVLVMKHRTKLATISRAVGFDVFTPEGEFGNDKGSIISSIAFETIEEFNRFTKHAEFIEKGIEEAPIEGELIESVRASNDHLAQALTLISENIKTPALREKIDYPDGQVPMVQVPRVPYKSRYPDNFMRPEQVPVSGDRPLTLGTENDSKPPLDLPEFMSAQSMAALDKITGMKQDTPADTEQENIIPEKYQ